VIGKLIALAPVAAALVVGAWVLSYQVATTELPSLRSTLALAGGSIAIGMMAAGIATVVPKHGMALSVVYIVLVDSAVGAIPASIRSISVTRQVVLLAGFDRSEASIDVVEPAITMAIIACAWLAVGFWRIRKLES